MSEQLNTINPVLNKDRYLSLDIIRGIALFGILLMNITGFGLPMAYNDPTVYGGAEGNDLLSWIITQMLFEGTQRGLFSILFGAGIILLTSRLEASGRKNSHDIYFRRNLWLVLFGLIHAYFLLWVGEILFIYGVTALFMYSFRNMSPKHLFTIAIIGLLAGSLLNLYTNTDVYDQYLKYEVAIEAQNNGQELSKEQMDNITAWEDIVNESKPDEEKIQHSIEGFTGSYLDTVLFLAPIIAEDQANWIYRYFHDQAAMMLIGMALFKLGFLTLQATSRVYLSIMIIGYVIGLTTNYYEVTTILNDNFSTQAFYKSWVTYDLGRLAMTMGHLGLLLLFCRSGILGLLKKGLAAVGQMALTNYLSHSIICAFIFYGFGLSLYGQLARHELYYVVFAIWLFQLIASPIWLKYYRFGPVEWLWRSLTYLQKQPFKKIT